MTEDEEEHELHWTERGQDEAVLGMLKLGLNLEKFVVVSNVLYAKLIDTQFCRQTPCLCNSFDKE